MMLNLWLSWIYIYAKKKIILAYKSNFQSLKHDVAAAQILTELGLIAML